LLGQVGNPAELFKGELVIENRACRQECQGGRRQLCEAATDHLANPHWKQALQLRCVTHHRLN